MQRCQLHQPRWLLPRRSPQVLFISKARLSNMVVILRLTIAISRYHVCGIISPFADSRHTVWKRYFVDEWNRHGTARVVKRSSGDSKFDRPVPLTAYGSRREEFRQAAISLSKTPPACILYFSLIRILQQRCSSLRYPVRSTRSLSTVPMIAVIKWLQIKSSHLLWLTLQTALSLMHW